MTIDFGVGSTRRRGAGRIDFGIGDSSRSSSLPAVQDPSIIERIAGGTLVGARRHFLLKPVIDRIAGAIPGVGTDTLDRMEARLEGSRLSDVFEFVGEFGPELAAGFGVFGLGRVAAVRALAWAGRTGTGARLLPAAARTAARYGAEGGAGGKMIAKPLLERGAEIAGGSAALGGYSGAATLAEGGTLDDAGRAALTTAALVGGAEVGMAAVFGRLARARSVDPAKAEEVLQKSNAVFKSEADRMTKQIGRINQRIESVNNRVSQELELAQARMAGTKGQPGLSGFLATAKPSEAALKRGLLKAEERAEKFYDDVLPKWESRVKRYEAKKEAWQGYRSVTPAGAIYTANKPYNPKDIRLMISQLALKLTHTPESFRGKLGPSFARVFQQLDTAESMTTVASAYYQGTIDQWVGAMQKGLGISNRQVHKDRAVFLPIFNEWEKLGEGGVRAFMAKAGRGRHTEEVVKVFDEIESHMMRIYQPLVDMGAEPALTPELLRQLGVKKYFPHLFDDLPEDQIMTALAARVGESKAAQMWDAYSREGLPKFSSIDWNRTRAGSLADKVGDKLPYDPNPFNNLFRYLTATHRRFEYGSRFGMSGELKEPMLKAIRAEATVQQGGRIVEDGQGAVTLAGNIIDTVLNQPYYPRAMRQVARIALGTQIFSKLPLAVIPNAFQPMNLMLWAGTRNLGKGFIGAVKGEKRDEIMAATALGESLIRGFQRTWGEARVGPAMVEGQVVERLANAADKLGYWTLSRTGFSMFERWNRTWSGYGAHYMFRDTLAKAVNGKLRGNNLDIARRRFESMRVNLDDLVRKIREGGDDFLAGPEFKQAEILATFKGAQTTQFIPARTRRPILWNHPLGRVFTQFKSFGLGQGKLIRDQVFAEAARGNLKPMAYFLSIYPVAGEVVNELRSVARGKPREQEGVTRFLGDFSAVGGVGIFTDGISAAEHGGLGDFLFGPTVGDFVGFAENMVQRDTQAIIAEARRQPVWQAVTSLSAAAILTIKALSDYVEEFPSFSSENVERTGTVDFGEARHREIMKKGRPQ